MPLQYGIRRRRAGEQRCEFLGQLSHLADQGGGLDFHRFRLVPVDDPAKVYLSAQQSRQSEGIEPQQHFVLPLELVVPDKANGQELSSLALRRRLYALQGMNTGFPSLRSRQHVNRQPPLCLFQIVERWRGQALALGGVSAQAVYPSGTAGIGLDPNPVSVLVPCPRFTQRPQVALRRAIEESPKEIRGDVHILLSP